MNYEYLEKKYIAQTYKRQNLLIEKGKGATAISVEGKEYIDFTSGIGVNSLGYAPDEIKKAITEQFGKVQHTSNIFFNKPAIELAEKLCVATGFNKVFFANSGAEANECALKLVRKYHYDKKDGKYKIIAIKNSFHGRTMATLTLTGQEVFHKDFLPLLPGVEYVDENTDLDTLKDVGGIFIELIQGEGGVIPINGDFLRRLFAYAERNDCLIVDDEVQTGIGRTGKLLCLENFDIKPDIVTLAKGLGGGIPIGACLIGERIKDTFTYSSHGSTFGGNPISTSAANAVMDIVNKESFLQSVQNKAKYFKERLNEIKGIENISGIGLMIGFQVKNIDAAVIVEECFKNALLVLTAKSRIRLLPPLNISYEEIDQGLKILKNVVEKMICDKGE